MSLTWVVALLVSAAWVGAMGIVVVMQRRSAAATIAWLMVLTFLPILGLLVYRFIGPLRLERKKVRRRRSRKLVDEALGAIAAIARTQDQDQIELARVGISVGEAPPLRADAVEVYTDGVSNYAAICGAIEAAQHHVHLEYYIWEPDHFGLRLIDLLAQRARAGVKVRMLVDGLGSLKLKRRHLAPLRAAGAEVAWFNPVTLRVFRGRRADFRSHRKIVVCDGKVGFTGGMNVTDLHTAEFSGARAWRDTHLRIAGSAVRAMQRIFLDDWYFANDKLPDTGPEYFPEPQGEPGKHIVQIISSGPDSTTFPIQRAFFTAMNAASRRLWITTPYFIPDEAILTALVTAALRRVDVKVIIPRRGDSRLIDLAARSYLPELLAAGVRVFEYTPRFIHAKTMAIDEGVSIVGTANLDNRSFRLNFEVAALVFGEETNAVLARAFETDLADAHELVLPEIDGAPFLTRLGQAGARLMSPLL
jgi:cardiolipin synthase A/B